LLTTGVNVQILAQRRNRQTFVRRRCRTSRAYGAKTSKRPKKNVATKRLIGTTYERLMSLPGIGDHVDVMLDSEGLGFLTAVCQSGATR